LNLSRILWQCRLEKEKNAGPQVKISLMGINRAKIAENGGKRNLARGLQYIWA
jgi:hypothetical protein